MFGKEKIFYTIGGCRMDGVGEWYHWVTGSSGFMITRSTEDTREFCETEYS